MLFVNLPVIYYKDLLFVVILFVGFFFFMYLIFVPVTTPYKFQTVTKFSDYYENPIYLTFHWETDDELMVGKKIKMLVEISDLPYTVNDTLSDIMIKFDGLNYFSDPRDESNNKISKIDYVTLKPDWDTHVFRSNQIQIRYLVPEDESIQLCDHNIHTKCMTITKIIHPAPHDTFVQIDTARTNAGVSIAVLLLTDIIVWFSLRNNYAKNGKSRIFYKKLFYCLVIVSIFLIIFWNYWNVFVTGDIS